MFKTIKWILMAASIYFLTACHSHDKNILKVGTISGPETELMEVAREVAKDRFNLNFDIVEFTDYVQPNAALNDGSIDANMFQHQPYLERQIKDHHYNLVVVGKTFVYPMGVYSTKVKLPQNIAAGSTITIPNDPSNEGRALFLLERAGLIDVRDDAGLYATPNDIVGNPKHLHFKELDAAQLARSLPDVDAAVINTNYAIPAGLSPMRDAIFHEGMQSPYANVIVVRADEKDDPRIKKLVEAFQSPEVADAAKKIFHDQAIPAWGGKK